MISKIPTRSEIPESDTWWRFERALSGSLWGPERCSTFGLGASRTNQCSPNLQMDYLRACDCRCQRRHLVARDRLYHHLNSKSNVYFDSIYRSKIRRSL